MCIRDRCNSDCFVSRRWAPLPHSTNSRRIPVQQSHRAKRCTILVSTSCRPRGTPREPEESRPGFILHQALSTALKDSHLEEFVSLKPVECLSLCPRPCGVAISSPGAWTYLFGDQAPESNEILACVETYLAEEQGHLPRHCRPTSMQASIMGRVPPLNDL